MKISGVVVWYNPTINEVNNIKTYINDLDKLFIVDNSNHSNSFLLEKLNEKKIEYICNYENFGIAKALNIGCELAMKNEYEWILTMDQDSEFDNNFELFIREFKEKIKISADKIAIFAPKTSSIDLGGYKTKIITSGNILNLEAYKKVKGFDEEFFIDEVDFDMGFKLLKEGYLLYQTDNIVMKHKLGDTKYFKLFGKKIFSSMNHGYIRKYYIIRNRFEMIRRYPNLKKEYLKIIITDFIKMILLEKNKWIKIKYCLKGYLDYKNKKFGKIREE